MEYEINDKVDFLLHGKPASGVICDMDKKRDRIFVRIASGEVFIISII